MVPRLYTRVPFSPNLLRYLRPLYQNKNIQQKSSSRQRPQKQPITTAAMAEGLRYP